MCAGAALVWLEMGLGMHREEVIDQQGEEEDEWPRTT